MTVGDFVWVRPRRSSTETRAAVVLGKSEPSNAVKILFNGRGYGWRVALLEPLLRNSELRIFEAVDNQILRTMSPLEALAWSMTIQ